MDKIPVRPGVDLEKLAVATDGYTGAGTAKIFPLVRFLKAGG